MKNLKSNLKENSRLPCYAINPFTKNKIPLFLKNDSEFGTLNSQGIPYVDSKLGIPSLSELDKNFAQQNRLTFKEIIDLSNNSLTNSDKVKTKKTKI